jgi:hypothetical protein
MIVQHRHHDGTVEILLEPELRLQVKLYEHTLGDIREAIEKNRTILQIRLMKKLDQLEARIRFLLMIHGIKEPMDFIAAIEKRFEQKGEQK